MICSIDMLGCVSAALQVCAAAYKCDVCICIYLCIERHLYEILSNSSKVNTIQADIIEFMQAINPNDHATATWLFSSRMASAIRPPFVRHLSAICPPLLRRASSFRSVPFHIISELEKSAVIGNTKLTKYSDARE